MNWNIGKVIIAQSTFKYLKNTIKEAFCFLVSNTLAYRRAVKVSSKFVLPLFKSIKSSAVFLVLFTVFACISSLKCHFISLRDHSHL